MSQGGRKSQRVLSKQRRGKAEVLKSSFSLQVAPSIIQVTWNSRESVLKSQKKAFVLGKRRVLKEETVSVHSGNILKLPRGKTNKTNSLLAFGTLGYYLP